MGYVGLGWGMMGLGGGCLFSFRMLQLHLTNTTACGGGALLCTLHLQPCECNLAVYFYLCVFMCVCVRLSVCRLIGC